MAMDNVRVERNRQIISAFFGKTGNYDKLRLMCRWVIKNQEEAEDALHNIFLTTYANAATNHFPVTEAEAFAYMNTAIINYRNDMLKKAKHEPLWVDEDEALEKEDVEGFSVALKLDEANEFVLGHEHLFTREQLLLWEYINDKKKSKEMACLLGKTSNMIYVMRFNLLRY